MTLGTTWGDGKRREIKSLRNDLALARTEVAVRRAEVEMLNKRLDFQGTVRRELAAQKRAVAELIKENERLGELSLPVDEVIIRLMDRNVLLVQERDAALAKARKVDDDLYDVRAAVAKWNARLNPEGGPDEE